MSKACIKREKTEIWIFFRDLSGKSLGILHGLPGCEFSHWMVFKDP
jgi:hypothetical protein